MEECIMVEVHTGYFLIGVLIFTIYHLAETTKPLGGGDLPRKDASMIFELLLGGVWVLVIINTLIYIVTLPSELSLLAAYKILPLGILIISAVIFGSKAFIAPSKNFLISLLIGAFVIFFSAYFLLYVTNVIMQGGLLELLINSLYCVLIGLGAGLFCYGILWKINSSGKEILWNAQSLWKVIKNRKFLIIFIVIIGIESYFQLQMESILVIFFN